MIGGLDRVFEIGKVFRNESVTSSHSPEFTSCEFYQAYADLPALMKITEDIFAGARDTVLKALVVTALSSLSASGAFVAQSCVLPSTVFPNSPLPFRARR